MLRALPDGVILSLALFLWITFCLLWAGIVYYLLELISMGLL